MNMLQKAVILLVLKLAAYAVIASVSWKIALCLYAINCVDSWASNQILKNAGVYNPKER